MIPSPVHMMGRLLNSVDRSTYRPTYTHSPSAQAFSGRSFDVDPDTGFFPSQPFRKLSGAFELWEKELEAARLVLKLGGDRGEEAMTKCAKGEQWRQHLRSWPTLDIEQLGPSVRVLRRAHYVLTCLLHFYVNSLPPYQVENQVVIPKPLAIPLVEVSRKIDMPPVLTFADIVLWNWEPVDPEQPMSLDNMHYVNLFSGTTTERNFYLLSAAAELKGVEMLRIIERVLNMPCYTDRSAIAALTRDFTHLTKIIGEIAAILSDARKTVEPHPFYWLVRPWWNGSEAASPWVFEGVPSNVTFDLGGASAGQSSVMHALDAFLDIDHALKQTRLPAPSAENRRTAASGFMERMRRYMPQEHRAYLVEVQKRNVRDVVTRHPALKEPYNATVKALRDFRNAHIRIGTLFIISQANTTPPACMGKVELNESTREGHALGSGGNPVGPLLKAGRDATVRALLEE